MKSVRANVSPPPCQIGLKVATWFCLQRCVDTGNRHIVYNIQPIETEVERKTKNHSNKILILSHLFKFAGIVLLPFSGLMGRSLTLQLLLIDEIINELLL